MGRRSKRKGEPIDGVLLLDKPAGMTSNKALQKCRYLLNAQKGGHTGALDPLATGLLPLCFGQATKISSFVLGRDKTYQVSAILGQTTDTGDADGKVLETQIVEASQEDVVKAMKQFIGEYEQIPPMYSALKVNGQPLYKLARQGIEIEREARRVSAYDIRFVSLDHKILTFEVDCSSGFYVRSLVEDIGKVLGCGAHVKTLRRTKIGDIGLEDTCTIAEFEGIKSNDVRVAKLIAADRLIQEFTKVSLNAEQSADLHHGRLIELDAKLESKNDEWIRIYGPDAMFLGLGKIDEEGRLAPKRLFV